MSNNLIENQVTKFTKRLEEKIIYIFYNKYISDYLTLFLKSILNFLAMKEGMCKKIGFCSFPK